MGLKSLELEPTKENVLSTIKDDLIGRNESVWRFASFCNAQEGKCSIALDAKWGDGKTFFVKQTQVLLEAYNDSSTSLTDAERASVLKTFNSFAVSGEPVIEIEPHLCVYYDAWANDNDTDPILSLVYAITQAGICNYDIKKSMDFSEAAAGIIDFFTGKNAKDLVALLKNRDALLQIKEQKEIYDLVSEFLDELMNERGNRLIVFIDELDRCKPSYAVQLLERIKHYFVNDRITFVFSVNIDQLQHTIKRYYGNEFDACGYLDRFFDYRIGLPSANTSRYFENVGLYNTSYFFETVCKIIIKRFSFSLREIEKFYRTARVAAYKPTHANDRAWHPNNESILFVDTVIVPLLIALRMKDATLYYEFVEGRNPEPFLGIITMDDVDIVQGYCSRFLKEGESYHRGLPPNSVYVELREKLNEVYNAIFAGKGEKTDQIGRIVIGKCGFTPAMKDHALKVASLLSKESLYE